MSALLVGDISATALVLAGLTGGGTGICWFGSSEHGLSADEVAAAAGAGLPAACLHGGTSRCLPVGVGQGDGWLGRPALSGHRLGPAPRAGHDWSPRFTTRELRAAGETVRVVAADAVWIWLPRSRRSSAGRCGCATSSPTPQPSPTWSKS